MNGVRISKAVVLASVLIASYASAIGLGKAKLESWLGQKLNVTVALTDTQNLSADDILVRQIYGQSAQKLGLQDAINNPRYQIATATDTQSNLWIEVSSRHPINEPYVSFVLQVEMPSGSVSREYTLLIDMPPSLSEGSNTASSNYTSHSKNSYSTAADESTHTTENLAETYTVQQGDTLGQIAQRVRPNENIRLKAIIEHLYEHNSSSFEADNINHLIQGAVLQLPSYDEYAAMPKRQDLAPRKQQVRKPVPVMPSETVEQHRYSTYTVKPGDTLSQVADVIRPSKRIPLNAATQTLIHHNITTVGAFGGRLSIGQLLRIPPDERFYLEAGLPITSANQSPLQPQVTAKQAEPRELKAAVASASNNAPLEPETDIATEQPGNSSLADSRPLNSNKLLNDSQQLQSALKAISERTQKLQHQNPELLLKIDRLVALQQEQLAITRRLVNAQRTAVTKSKLAKNLPPPSKAIETEATINSTPTYLYAVIALLSLLVVWLSAKLYWPLTLNRNSNPSSQSAADSDRASGSKDTAKHHTAVEQSPSTTLNSEHDKAGNLESAHELAPDFNLDLDLGAPLITEAPRYTADSAGQQGKITQGQSAESEQIERDRKLHQKLADRNLEVSNTPAFDNNFIDSAPVNLDEIFQPEDEDSISAFSNSHKHAENDRESNVIWQANIYSAYGQHSRAESLLNEGLHSNPSSIALKLALLDIYARSAQHEKFEVLCTDTPQNDPCVKASIQQWRDEFNIPSADG